MDLGLGGKRVLITGASQGIGEGIAEVFAEEGAVLHLTSRSADKLDAIAARLRKAHGTSVTTYPMDLTGGEAPLRLTGTEQALLKLLADTPRQPVSRIELIEDLGSVKLVHLDDGRGGFVVAVPPDTELGEAALRTLGAAPGAERRCYGLAYSATPPDIH